MNKKNLIFFTLPNLFSTILMFGLLPIYTKVLGPEDYGLVAVITIILGLVISLSDNGSGWVVSSNFHKDNFDIKQLCFGLFFTGLVLKTLFICMFYFFDSYIINNFINDIPVEVDIYLLYYLLLFSLFLTCFDSLALSYMIINEDGKIYMILQILGVLISNIAILISLFVFELDVLSLILGMVFLRIFNFLFYFIYMYKKISINFDKRIFSEIFEVGFPAIFKTTSTYVLGNIDKFFMQYFISISTLGIYEFGLKFKMLQEVVSKSFNRVYGAYFFKSYENFNQKDHNEICNKWLSLNFLLSLGMIFFIENFVDILTNGKFNESAKYIQLFFISSLVNSYVLFYTLILVAEKRTKFIMKNSIVVGIVSSILMYFGIKYFGAISAAYILIIGSFLYLVTYMIFLNKKKYISFDNKNFIFLFLLLIISLFLRNNLFLPLLDLNSFIGLVIFYLIVATIVFKKYNYYETLKGLKNA